ncbi:bifunctional glutamate N-acetyltransferase/amino-acid acetyltransferase ArgJ [Microbulbifer agarilyticus]|uniref:bifunctional glutamate N-acetyltransferase/amino-acid acetyltransferase ArgJ n=1 Tax=Microbulbifer agarilyticus TaxID=260552 RepID=UPI001C975C56|nr:bifunctional glutamate N-acetyltransferase/amino-acid acetyltransferase ArgJ [Microbulbifer agarilyticus]MBY6191446.1 bifunctional glutamate N-acetyltransferase/amino-acid acetyltransferase ArgJ [Microbulbifer agarilyticus]MCA0894261.1 bifunctional glutamate N-acetyltransferase/amino-acid acetyltransferase ArgJ [Microbulbifer agarilyticus]
MAQPLPSIPGIRLAAVPAKVKDWQRDDLLLIEIAEGASVSATFTQNAFCAAPVLVAKEHIRQGGIRALLVNAGNANAATGEQGLLDANRCCEGVAQALGVRAQQVLPFSTGVIGEHLPVQNILNAIPTAAAQLQAEGWESAATAIMTTDTRPKTASRSLEIAGETISIVGIAKGAGMIQPNMATMLAYVATDARIPQGVLDALVQEAVAASFNRISVDGDTSTNDACVLIASGATGPEIADTNSDAYAQLKAAIIGVHIELAQAIVKDGEGATKFVTVQVNSAASSEEALRMAFEIGESPLVKTALYASDPNWGRLVMAIGNAGAKNLDTSKISVYLDDVQIVEAGGRASSYTEDAGQKVFEQPEFTISVDLQRGDVSEHIWTCDFSHEYVTINAEYRT